MLMQHLRRFAIWYVKSLANVKIDNGTLITYTVKIANILGAAIEKSSSSKTYSKEFQSIKAQKEEAK